MDFTKITSWSIPGMTNVLKVLDSRGKIIWQRNTGGGDSDTFIPFTLSLSDGICALQWTNTSTARTYNMKPSVNTTRKMYIFSSSTAATAYVGIPLSGYAYTHMPVFAGTSENSQYIANNYTLICVPKGCSAVTFTWTSSPGRDYTITMQVRSLDDGSTLVTSGAVMSTRANKSESLNVSTICSDQPRWLEIALLYDDSLSTNITQFGDIQISFT